MTVKPQHRPPTPPNPAAKTSRCEEVYVGRTRSREEPWLVCVTYMPKIGCKAMFNIDMSPSEALELAARLVIEADEAWRENEKKGEAA